MRIALLVSELGDGGVERTLTNLAAGLARHGQSVDFLAGRPEHPYLRDLGAGVRVIPLRGRPEAALRSYLLAEHADILLTGKLADDVLALRTRNRARVGTRLVTTVGTHLSARLAVRRLNPLPSIRDRLRIRGVYRRLDGVVAVSPSVATDLKDGFGLESVPVQVLCNPIVPDDVEALAVRPCPHPWLAPDQPPVILAVGGLRQVKDFPTLLRAVARLTEATGARLLILGEGRERARLTALAAELGLSGRFALPGFDEQPYPYLARARVLALSSRREGLGNVLVEAMAVGTPVVATDCPGGVRDLLGNGRLGPLVRVGDPDALAAAMLTLMQGPTDPTRLRQAAEPYRILTAAAAYLRFFRDLLEPRAGARGG